MIGLFIFSYSSVSCSFVDNHQSKYEDWTKMISGWKLKRESSNGDSNNAEIIFFFSRSKIRACGGGRCGRADMIQRGQRDVMRGSSWRSEPLMIPLGGPNPGVSRGWGGTLPLWLNEEGQILRFRRSAATWFVFSGLPQPSRASPLCSPLDRKSVQIPQGLSGLNVPLLL